MRKRFLIALGLIIYFCIFTTFVFAAELQDVVDELVILNAQVIDQAIDIGKVKEAVMWCYGGILFFFTVHLWRPHG